MHFRLNLVDLAYRAWGCRRSTMPERTFREGCLAGWRWVRGDDQVPIVPACSVSKGEAPFRAAVMDGLRDGCTSRQTPVATNSEQIENWYGRALHPRRISVR